MKKQELELRDKEIELKKHSLANLTMTSQFVQEEIDRHEWEKEMIKVISNFRSDLKLNILVIL